MPVENPKRISKLTKVAMVAGISSVALFAAKGCSPDSAFTEDKLEPIKTQVIQSENNESNTDENLFGQNAIVILVLSALYGAASIVSYGMDEHNNSLG